MKIKWLKYVQYSGHAWHMQGARYMLALTVIWQRPSNVFLPTPGQGQTVRVLEVATILFLLLLPNHKIQCALPLGATRIHRAGMVTGEKLHH